MKLVMPAWRKRFFSTNGMPLNAIRTARIGLMKMVVSSPAGASNLFITGMSLVDISFPFRASALARKGSRGGRLTVHEVWEENKELSFLCVFVGEKTTVDELPSKGIVVFISDAFGVILSAGLAT
jgi:hypothetical protein